MKFLSETNIRYLNSNLLACDETMQQSHHGGPTLCVADPCYGRTAVADPPDVTAMMMSDCQALLPITSFRQVLRLGPPTCLKLTTNDREAGQKQQLVAGMMDARLREKGDQRICSAAKTTWHHHAATINTAGSRGQSSASRSCIGGKGDGIMKEWAAGGFEAIIAHDLHLQDIDTDLCYVLPSVNFPAHDDSNDAVRGFASNRNMNRSGKEALTGSLGSVATSSSSRIVNISFSDGQQHVTTEPLIWAAPTSNCATSTSAVTGLRPAANSVISAWRSALLHLHNNCVSARHEPPVHYTSNSSLDLYLDWTLMGHIPHETELVHKKV
jgi:hypothetical protein